MAHEIDVFVRVREVRAVHVNGQDGLILGLGVEAYERSDWWLKCRRCLTAFNPPDGLDIRWPEAPA